jgi:DNA polymerase III sliding clamp (beta) subunit (PCNA family)
MFNVKTSKSDLVMAIGFVKEAVPNRPDAPIFGTIFMEQEDGKLKLRASNGEVDRVYYLGCAIEADESCCVDPIIFSIIQSFEDSLVTLEKTPDNKLKVTSEGKTHKINFIPGNEYPDQRPEVEEYVSTDYDSLIISLRKAAIAVSEDINSVALTCFYINGTNGSIISTDGYQVVVINGVSLPEKDSLLPAKQLTKLPKPSQSDHFQIAVGTNFGMKTDNWEVRIVGISLKYPQAKEITYSHKEMPEVMKIRVNRHDFIRSLEVCRIYASRASSLGFANHTKLTKTGDEITLSMTVSGVASFEEPIQVEEYLTSTDEFTILFDSARTLEAVRQMETNLIAIKFIDRNKPFLISEVTDDLVENENFIYLEVSMQG